jgi:hypothetical protein
MSFSRGYKKWAGDRKVLRTNSMFRWQIYAQRGTSEWMSRNKALKERITRRDEGATGTLNG